MVSCSVVYQLNQASETQIAEHLSRCDADFVPALSGRLDINDYAKKIACKAERFESWSGGVLIGLVAAYSNDHLARIAYITSVSVLKAWTGKGIATHLIEQCVKHVKASGMQEIRLEVARNNMTAISLYERIGFVAGKTNASFITMDLYFKSGGEHEQQA